MNKILDLIVKDNYPSCKEYIYENENDKLMNYIDIDVEQELRSYYNYKLREDLNFNLYRINFTKKYRKRFHYFFSHKYTQFLSYEFFTQYMLVNEENIKKYKNKNKYYDYYLYKFKSFYLTKIIFIQNRNIHIYYISNPTKKYDNNYFLDGFLLLICDIKNKKGRIVDMRIKKEFFISNNKKLEKKELYFYKILINICYKYKIHKIIVNDCDNFYYMNEGDKCNMFTYYYTIYKKSWYEHKLFFTYIKSNPFDKRDSLYNANEYILLKKKLKKYKIKTFNDSCNFIKKQYYKTMIKKLLYYNDNNYHILNLFSKIFLHNYFISK